MCYLILAISVAAVNVANIRYDTLSMIKLDTTEHSLHLFLSCYAY